MPADGCKYLTVSEAARDYRRSTATLQRWITKGYRGERLPALRGGRGWLIAEPDLIDFFRRCDAASRGERIRLDPAEPVR